MHSPSDRRPDFLAGLGRRAPRLARAPGPALGQNDTICPRSELRSATPMNVIRVLSDSVIVEDPPLDVAAAKAFVAASAP